MPKVNIQQGLYDKLAQAAETAGYSSPDEFIVNMLEKEVAKFGDTESQEQLEERLRGLGFIE
jgi:metal-responsive CopG/Arc/MetJ family transcriptional regulator